MSLLGFPLVRYIDIDDAESVLRAIRETPPGRPIEIILHTPGGLVIAAQQIASALADHDGQVTAVVPHYAMSGGTLIALAADEIVSRPSRRARPGRPAARPVPGRLARRGRRAARRPRGRDLDHGRRRPQGDRPGPGLHRRAAGGSHAAEQAREVAQLLSTGRLDARSSAACPVTWQHSAAGPVGVPEQERELMRSIRSRAGVSPASSTSPGGPRLPGSRRGARYRAPGARRPRPNSCGASPRRRTPCRRVLIAVSSPRRESYAYRQEQGDSELLDQ